MIPLPDLNFSVLAPVGFVAVGAMMILMGEVFLSRTAKFLGRDVTESFIGTILASTAVFFLALTIIITSLTFASGGSEVFNPDNPMYQLDPFSSLVTALAKEPIRKYLRADSLLRSLRRSKPAST